MTNLRLLDTFSGIGGFSLAARWLGGFETVAFVERDPFCQQILRKHWPNVPIHHDITTFAPKPDSADVICGGFPCQDISTAGKQAGIKQGTRSGLFYELMRVVRVVGPRFVVLENVSAILGNGMDSVLGELADAGFDAEWACIPASALGACHQRDRWWCVAKAVADTDGGAGSIGGEQLLWGPPAREHSKCSQDSIRSSDGVSRSGQKADAADTNDQRQQEQHPPAIADRQGWPRWGDAPRRLNPDWRSYLSEPVLCRGDDGLSGRVDRIKALGNAVVPQVAMIPLRRVLELASPCAEGVYSIRRDAPA